MYLFIIEGIDGSGKATQLSLLKDNLEKAGKTVMPISFPNYSDRSSGPVKMYLEGELGKDPSDVSAYAASSLFAIDRFASYKKTWEKPYKDGTVIISDRYVLSNIIHQASKLPDGEKKAFVECLYDLEYNKLGIPKPTASFFLDVPPEVSMKNIEKRYSGDESKKDIHEQNRQYMTDCYRTAKEILPLLGVKAVDCTKNGEMRPAGEIGEKIFAEIEKILGD